MRLTALPVDDVLPQLVAALRSGPAVVLEAPPGAGKSTRVPPALLDAGLADSGMIVVLEPRRAAARSVARRVAFERGEQAGQTIGYSVRFEKKRSKHTRVMVVTEGILTRRFAADPFIEDIACVVLDEFHERSTHVDLALAFLKELMTVRDDLKVVVMSATMDGQAVADWLGGCPVIRCKGRVFPTTISHLGSRDRFGLSDQVTEGIRRLLADPDDDGGDILAFLPGVAEIHRTQRTLEAARLPKRLEVVPLYGALPAAQQDRALSPGARRRVVLATNIAETSLTIEGVTSVVDAGWAKVMSHDPHRGMDRLEMVPISKASATQRAGRAGRTAPGRVVRLWSELEHHALADAETAEINRVDLAPVLLHVMQFQPGDPSHFGFFEAPEPNALAQAMDLLARLGAIEPGGFDLTKKGGALAELPLHPRLGAVLLKASKLGIIDEGAAAAALLSERDILRRNATLPTTPSDLTWRVSVFEAIEAARFSVQQAEKYGADANGTRRVAKVRDQLRRWASSIGPKGRLRQVDDVDAAIRRALLAGYPDRVCKRRRPGDPEAAMVGGVGVRLEASSAVREHDVFIAIDVEAGRRGAHARGRVRQASAIDVDWLRADFPDLISEGVEAVFDPEIEAVVGRRVRRFDGLLLSESRGAKVGQAEAAPVLAEAAAGAWEKVFKPDKDSARLIQRLRFAGHVLPDDGFPDVSDEALQRWLPELCWGRRRFTDLTAINWTKEIRARVDWNSLNALDRIAPDRITVPSGSKIVVDYSAVFEPSGVPILAVRLQELFGLTSTPTVARGRVVVLLHLLGPNYRPVQVTQDLSSFWNNTYPEVRKELRRRYPKHSWPEDPWTAEPVRGARRRR